MAELDLTPEELRLVSAYAVMPTSIRPRIPSWLSEVGLPLGFAIYGVVTHQPVFLGAAVGGLLAVNAMRMLRQYKYSRLLQSICTKIKANVGTGQDGA